MGSATIPHPLPHWYTQAMFIKAVWRNGSSTSLCLGAETSWNDLEKNKQHSLTKVQITFNQNIPQGHNGNLSYLVSLGVFNHWKCFIALVTLKTSSLVPCWCKCDCKWISFILSQASALCGESSDMEGSIINHQLTASLTSANADTFDHHDVWYNMSVLSNINFISTFQY